MRSTGRKEECLAALEAERKRIDERLVMLLDQFAGGPPVIVEAVRYMALDGGKRLRPALCLWTHDALGGSARNACMDAACAIECLHTYSLVHDDLPCMDDDDLRRGRPSCHKKFGEAVAVLAGDALLTLSFEILASMTMRWGAPESAAIEAARIVARAGGTGGLIGGQVLDIAAAPAGAGIEYVDRIHAMKTGALIAASMECGAVMAGAKKEARERIRRAGERAGRAFQIIDDVLDMEADEASLGKTPGKDAAAGKLTYASVLGAEESRVRAAELIAEAGAAFGEGLEGDRVRSLLEYLAERRR